MICDTKIVRIVVSRVELRFEPEEIALVDSEVW